HAAQRPDGSPGSTLPHPSPAIGGANRLRGLPAERVSNDPSTGQWITGDIDFIPVEPVRRQWTVADRYGCSAVEHTPHRKSEACAGANVRRICVGVANTEAVARAERLAPHRTLWEGCHRRAPVGHVDARDCLACAHGHADD